GRGSGGAPVGPTGKQDCVACPIRHFTFIGFRNRQYHHGCATSGGGDSLASGARCSVSEPWSVRPPRPPRSSGGLPVSSRGRLGAKGSCAAPTGDRRAPRGTPHAIIDHNPKENRGRLRRILDRMGSYSLWGADRRQFLAPRCRGPEVADL